jgi:subtilisin family serine protease
MMKVRVNAYLNLRTGSPEILLNNNPAGQYLVPGQVVEIKRTVIGQEYKGNNIWHELADGTFVWAGGVGSKTSEFLVNDWLTFFQLDKINAGLQEELKASSVTLLDTGIDNTNPDLDDVLLHSRNFLFPQRSVMDFDGHGTHCAGILVANGKRTFTGVVKGAKINVGKIITTSVPGVGGLDHNILHAAIEWAAEQSDVISISAGITEYNATLHELVKRLAAKGKIIVASIGNKVNGNVLDPNYPAKFKECISVGSLTSQFEFSGFNIPDSEIDICFPGEAVRGPYLTADGGSKTMSGTSVSTPFVAGIVLLLKLMKPEMKVEDVRQSLAKYTITKASDQFSYKSIVNKSLII